MGRYRAEPSASARVNRKRKRERERYARNRGATSAQRFEQSLPASERRARAAAAPEPGVPVYFRGAWIGRYEPESGLFQPNAAGARRGLEATGFESVEDLRAGIRARIAE